MRAYGILEGKVVREIDIGGYPELRGLVKWAENFEKTDRKIARAELDGVLVSTVFLGMDHAYGDGPPHWFETMIFGGEHDSFCERYSTYDDALAGHARVVECLKSGRAIE